MITIVPYRDTWPAEFRELARAIRGELKELALRIDHIGSTSVPGLAAKDLIDIQITVENFVPEVEHALTRIGYRRVEEVSSDHIPPGGSDRAEEWTKWYFQPPVNERPVHIHVRRAGKANQRYPLLFRDYLRANPMAAEAYARVKMALAHEHADDIDAYYAVKDPVCDIIIAGAEMWAAAKPWQPGPSDG
jgi:GrpB-like predicted nucleotidyltransferase (UPF0157 family)